MKLYTFAKNKKIQKKRIDKFSEKVDNSITERNDNVLAIKDYVLVKTFERHDRTLEHIGKKSERRWKYEANIRSCTLKYSGCSRLS